MSKLSNKTRAICEAAVLVALALVLDQLRLYRLPSGGSITIAIMPLVFFAIRYGAGWGFLAGFVFGGLNYIVGLSSAIDWTTIICDYFLAFGLLGLGAGLCKRRKFSAYWGTLLGGVLMFLSSYLVGVFVWGKWMPEEFLGMTMTTPWFYSFLYNIIWAGPDVVLTLIIFAVFYQIKPMRRLLERQDLPQ
ncbi:MAG: ECF transporter S component [Oscillibacter sp.]|nr:ECF transporter S component [Oscillibacter sp.]